MTADENKAEAKATLKQAASQLNAALRAAAKAGLEIELNVIDVTNSSSSVRAVMLQVTCNEREVLL